ncbi:MAG: hypothetical protein FWG65_06460 [Turicibacter sp.]|nr:hypothetical protein [Turicibacter sp.]
MMKYPKQWIVMTELEWLGLGNNRDSGYVYGVYETREAAREVKLELEKTMNQVTIIEGYDDTPQIGGLFA